MSMASDSYGCDLSIVDSASTAALTVEGRSCQSLARRFPFSKKVIDESKNADVPAALPPSNPRPFLLIAEVAGAAG